MSPGCKDLARTTPVITFKMTGLTIEKTPNPLSQLHFKITGLNKKVFRGRIHCCCNSL